MFNTKKMCRQHKRSATISGAVSQHCLPYNLGHAFGSRSKLDSIPWHSYRPRALEEAGNSTSSQLLPCLLLADHNSSVPQSLHTSADCGGEVSPAQKVWPPLLLVLQSFL